MNSKLKIAVEALKFYADPRNNTPGSKTARDALAAIGPVEPDGGALESLRLAIKATCTALKLQEMRAEKAEAELEEWCHTNRIDELQRSHNTWQERALAAEDKSNNLSAKLEVFKTQLVESLTELSK